MGKRDFNAAADPTVAERNELGIIIFVRNLPLETDDTSLFSLFSEHGVVRKVTCGSFCKSLEIFSILCFYDLLQCQLCQCNCPLCKFLTIFFLLETSLLYNKNLISVETIILNRFKLFFEKKLN